MIIGGGPAGMTAAIQLHRQGIGAVLFEKDELGGLMNQAGWIENYPGFPAGIKGGHLARIFHDQLSRFPIDVRNEEISTLDYEPETRRFSARSSRGRLSAAHVVVASGTKPMALPVPASLDPDVLSRVFYDWRKIPEQGRSRVAVVGAGDIALDYALSLSSNHEVIILCRGEKSRALPGLQKRVREARSIELLFQSKINEALPGTARPLRLSGKRAGNNFIWDADFVLCAAGRQAAKDFYSPRLKHMERELIAAESLFPVGDAKNGIRRQIGIAVGDGLACALTIAGISPRSEDESHGEND
ncbi:MAG: NAD(P)/FAD-dependent oxidoreductase [Candidatus Aminicenantes bacterium]|nr:NAD(P)/FAD-dependent oxidoreductase [Candidatus Aminicenantes bacterium]